MSIVGVVVGLVEVGEVEGPTVDDSLGKALVGVNVGEEGAIVGTFVGATVAVSVGATVKLTAVGNTDGIIEGEYDGDSVVGTIVVITVGTLVGVTVGVRVGDAVGPVGDKLGILKIRCSDEDKIIVKLPWSASRRHYGHLADTIITRIRDVQVT